MTERIINKIKIQHYECVDSTNLIAMNESKLSHLLTVVSDTQTGGKGRMGREFYSYQGGLYMSVILEPKKVNIPIHLITPTAALAVKKALCNAGIDGLSIKWVNDILLEGKKICGILTEAKTLDNEIERIVVGIGINLKKHDSYFPEEIQHKAKSLDYRGEKLELAAQISSFLGKYILCEPKEIISEYIDNMAYIGDKITVTDYSDNNSRITGEVMGVTDDCFLKLLIPNGQLKILSSGEII